MFRKPLLPRVRLRQLQETAVDRHHHSYTQTDNIIPNNKKMGMGSTFARSSRKTEWMFPLKRIALITIMSGRDITIKCSPLLVITLGDRDKDVIGSEKWLLVIDNCGTIKPIIQFIQLKQSFVSFCHFECEIGNRNSVVFITGQKLKRKSQWKNPVCAENT